MTLYKQIVLLLSVIFIFLFGATIWVQFSHSRDYLNDQEEITLNNTINSLGLALVPYLEAKDPVGAESVINAAFDGGFLESISLNYFDTSTVPIIKKYPLNSEFSHVPDWFINLGFFKQKSLEITLTSGWLQFGKLTVTANPRDAYYQLWNTTQTIFQTYSLIFVICCILFVFILKWILIPLQLLENQSVKIQNHLFDTLNITPKTRELKNLVDSMNTLTTKLDHQFQESEHETNKLKNLVYLDAITGVGNRKFFLSTFKQLTANGHSGILLVISCEVLNDIFSDYGFIARDETKRNISNAIIENVKRYSGGFVSLISDTEFVVVLPDVSSTLDNICVSYLDVFQQIKINHNKIYLAALDFDSYAEISELLAKADMALRYAKHEKKRFKSIKQSEIQAINKLTWLDILQKAIDGQMFNYQLHSVKIVGSDEVYHEELYTRINYDGKTTSAAGFIDMIENNKMAVDFDLLNINKAFSVLEQYPQKIISINLTAQSISSPSFIAQLNDVLRINEFYAHRIMFEFSESALIQQSNNLELLVDLFRKYSIQWGIDQFGRYLKDFNFLKKSIPSFVKIDSIYTDTLNTPNIDQQKELVVTALARMAHQVGAKAFVTHIESEQSIMYLDELLVDGYQGFYVRPSDV